MDRVKKSERIKATTVILTLPSKPACSCEFPQDTEALIIMTLVFREAFSLEYFMCIETCEFLNTLKLNRTAFVWGLD